MARKRAKVADAQGNGGSAGCGVKPIAPFSDCPPPLGWAGREGRVGLHSPFSAHVSPKSAPSFVSSLSHQKPGRGETVLMVAPGVG